MAELVCALDVRLPDAAARASRAHARVKAQASLTLSLEGSDSKTIYIPSRVARQLDASDISLPQPIGDVLRRIDEMGSHTCFTVLVELLSRRDYSWDEARHKLLRDGYSERHVHMALEKAMSYRYLDDARFARQFIEQRIARGWGRRKIECELRRRGVDVNDLDDYPDAYFDSDRDLERAIDLLRRKSIPDNRPIERFARHLMNKGFTSSIAFAAARRRIEEENDSNE